MTEQPNPNEPKDDPTSLEELNDQGLGAGQDAGTSEPNTFEPEENFDGDQ